MKKFLFLTALLLSFFTSNAQNTEGVVISKMIESKALQNTGGENPNRKISIYLPPQYEQSNKRYPVIYYLHGFIEL